MGRIYNTRTKVVRGQCVTPFNRKWSPDSKYTKIVAVRALIGEFSNEMFVSDAWAPKGN